MLSLKRICSGVLNTKEINLFLLGCDFGLSKGASSLLVCTVSVDTWEIIKIFVPLTHVHPYEGWDLRT